MVGGLPSKPGSIKQPTKSRVFGDAKTGEFRDPQFDLSPMYDDASKDKLTIHATNGVKWMSGDKLVSYGNFGPWAPGTSGAAVAEQMIAAPGTSGAKDTVAVVTSQVPLWQPASVLTVGPIANVGATFSTTSPCTILKLQPGSELTGQVGEGDIILKMVSGDIVVDCTDKTGNDVAA